MENSTKIRTVKAAPKSKGESWQAEKSQMTRNAILEAAITHSGNPPLCILSISLGIATIQDGDTTTTLYQRADKALYLAKTSGRNRVSTGE